MGVRHLPHLDRNRGVFHLEHLGRSGRSEAADLFPLGLAAKSFVSAIVPPCSPIYLGNTLFSPKTLPL